MKVKWLGHASFVITAESGIKILTDPYEISDTIKYGEINESADIVTVSHEHKDHSNVAAVRGNPGVVRGTARVKGVEFKGIPTYHDENKGQQRGKNTILCFEMDGIRVCHLGDLGHMLSDKQVAEVGRVDILLLPVGGFYTIDAKVATQVAGSLKPRVIIPMHFKNEKCAFPITGVEEFLKRKKNISQPGTSEVEFKAGELPAATQIIVLKPTL